jgi:outer membrane immunogenic protein
MINRTLIAAVALATAGLSQAADVPLSPGYGWSGLYYGVNAGYDYNTLTVTDRDYFDGLGDNSTRSNGGMLGGQVGYNWQQRALVYGVEADLDGLTNSKTDNNDTRNEEGSQAYAQIVSKLEALGSVRGRIGIAADPAWLYLTGGIAVAHVNDAYNDIVDSEYWPSKGGVRFGFIGGVGVEWHASSRQTWKVEGLMYNLAENTSSETLEYGEGSYTYRQSFSNSGFMMRVGLNFR